MRSIGHDWLTVGGSVAGVVNQELDIIPCLVAGEIRWRIHLPSLLESVNLIQTFGPIGHICGRRCLIARPYIVCPL